jgi:hypothetical protein
MRERLAKMIDDVLTEIANIPCPDCRFEEMTSLRCELGGRLNEHTSDGETCEECIKRNDELEEHEANGH